MSVLKSESPDSRIRLTLGPYIDLRIQGENGKVTVSEPMICKYSKVIQNIIQDTRRAAYEAQEQARRASSGYTNAPTPPRALNPHAVAYTYGGQNQNANFRPNFGPVGGPVTTTNPYAQGNPHFNNPWAHNNVWIPEQQPYDINQQFQQLTIQRSTLQQPPSQAPPAGPVAVLLPPVNPQALCHLIKYMQWSCTKQDKPLEPPESTVSTILLFEAIVILKIPFCEKKFQARITDRFSKDDFSANDVRAVWDRLRIIDPKIVKHCIQNVAFRSNDGRGIFAHDGDMWGYLGIVPELRAEVIRTMGEIRQRSVMRRRPSGPYR